MSTSSRGVRPVCARGLSNEDEVESEEDGERVAVAEAAEPSSADDLRGGGIFRAISRVC